MHEGPDTGRGATLAAPMVTTVEVSGTPRERGRQYGEQARRQIEGSVGYYAALFERNHGVGWAAVAERALAWERPVAAFDADLAEEVRGIAEGSGRTVGDVLALNARGEMVYGGYLGRPVDGAAAATDGCTSFALLPEATADGHVYGGQNWDWRLATKDTWVVLRIVQPPKPTVITVVEAGQVGRHGANSAGLGVFANGLDGFCTPDPRVPQPFIRRRTLDQASFADALETVMSAPQQIAANVLLTHRDGFALDVETTPERHSWLYADEGRLVHGNHYEGFDWARDGDAYRPLAVDSIYRVRRVRDALRGAGEARGASGVRELIAAALADRFGFPDAVSAHARAEAHPLERWQTLTSSIVDFSSGEWWLAPGTPDDHAYAPLPWNLYDDEGPR